MTAGEVQSKHRQSGTPEHRAWTAMRSRCTDTHHPSYDRYGGRGITVCPRWQESFENFFADMGPRPSPDHSIERKNNNGPYAPWNCVWATRYEQNRNKRSNQWLTIGHETMCLADWAKRAGVRAITILYRLRRGWTPEEAIALVPYTRRPTAT